MFYLPCSVHIDIAFAQHVFYDFKMPVFSGFNEQCHFLVAIDGVFLSVEYKHNIRTVCGSRFCKLTWLTILFKLSSSNLLSALKKCTSSPCLTDRRSSSSAVNAKGDNVSKRLENVIILIKKKNK